MFGGSPPDATFHISGPQSNEMVLEANEEQGQVWEKYGPVAIWGR